jgi:putative Ca2+/H+ antiporter (TMEM165/GDT1 family)
VIEIFQTIFIACLVVFLMELGDKTQIASFALSARFQRPWVVFAGVIGGLCLVSIIAVLVGSLLREVVSPTTLSWFVSGGFIIIGVISILNARKPPISAEKFSSQCSVPMEKCPMHKEESNCRKEECPVYIRDVLGKGAFSCSLIVIFAAEIGDKTWITTLVLATQFDPLGVFIGAMVAFAIVNGIGIILGQRLAERIPKKKLDVAMGVSLIVIGLTVIGLSYS